MEIFSQLLEYLTSLIDFVLWMCPKLYRLHDGERGVVLTFGKVRRENAERGPGVTFCFPFEEMEIIQALGGYIDLDEQAVTTSEDDVVVINGAVEYSVTNATKAILEVEEESLEDLIAGMVQNMIREHAASSTLDSISNSDSLTNEIAGKVNARLKRYGAKVEKLMLTDLRPHEATLYCCTILDAVEKYRGEETTEKS